MTAAAVQKAVAPAARVPAAPAARAQAAPAARAHAADPVDQALRLQALLGHHSVLVADMMRSRLRGEPDFAQAADAALGRNTEAMGELVSEMFGADAAAAFTPVWGTHVTALFNYARGIADDDDAVRADARKVLQRYEKDLSTFFAGASKGRLKQADAQAALVGHVKHMIGQAEAYDAGDHKRYWTLQRESFAHTIAIGRTLSGTLLPPAAVAKLKLPENRLESEMSRLLGEHVTLVVATTRARLTDGPDFAAAAAAMDANTADLAGAIDALYGGPAAQQFESMWADHLDGMVAYATARAADDAAAISAAQAELGAFEGKLAKFLSGATEQRLPADALADAFSMHDKMLTEQIDEFAAKNYGPAHNRAYETYEHMGALARQLSDAIGSTVAARLPQGGAQTGGGGMATFVERDLTCRVLAE